MNSKGLYFLNRNFSILIYLFCVFCSLYLLYAARSEGLLPRPMEGTDQLSMLDGCWMNASLADDPVVTLKALLVTPVRPLLVALRV